MQFTQFDKIPNFDIEIPDRIFACNVSYLHDERKAKPIDSHIA